MSEPEDFVVCRICGEEFQQIKYNHLKRHGMTFEEYRKGFPGVPTISGKARKKMSVAKVGKKSPFYGMTHTEETKAKISASKMGHLKSEETKAKMRAAWARRKVSEGGGG